MRAVRLIQFQALVMSCLHRAVLQVGTCVQNFQNRSSRQIAQYLPMRLARTMQHGVCIFCLFRSIMEPVLRDCCNCRMLSIPWGSSTGWGLRLTHCQSKRRLLYTLIGYLKSSQILPAGTKHGRLRCARCRFWIGIRARALSRCQGWDTVCGRQNSKWFLQPKAFMVISSNLATADVQ